MQLQPTTAQSPLAAGSVIDRDLHTQYKVWLIEKLIINFALPSDFVFHTWRAFKKKDKSQTWVQRIVAMWKGKVVKYQKLLRLKDENGGVIPEEYRTICQVNPCGRTRLYLASGWWRKPKKKRRRGAVAGQPSPIQPVIAPAGVAD